MQIIKTLPEVLEWRRLQRQAGRTVALVPTMGYLHQGHLTLCGRARMTADKVAASIFVNPLQFGKNEDLSTYPRDEGGDIVKLASVGVDMVFVPTVEAMYPPGFCTHVEVEELTQGLCGASRPGHFRGVATVVTRLFNLIEPHYAVFGLKDYQQFLVVRALVRDLGLKVEVLGVPIVRDTDGLALSSRNARLSPEERRAAPILHRVLLEAKKAYVRGERDAAALKQKALDALALEKLARVDYVEVVDALNLGVPSTDRPMLIALAVFFGRTRLIDNMLLERATEEHSGGSRSL